MAAHTDGLSIRHRKILTAASSRILPSGSGPGAAEAHAIGSIERAFRHRFFDAVRPWIEEGLDELQDQARKTYDSDFEDCRPEQQDAILAAAQQQPAFPLRMFFQTLIGWTLEGFLGDPAHGGNRNGVGWHFISYRANQPPTGFCLHDNTGHKEP